MAEFVKIWRRRHEVVDELAVLRKEAAQRAPIENRSASLIQRHYRGSIARRIIRQKSSAARTIQRVVRGNKGRQDAFGVRATKEARQEEAVYHYYATILQKMFRGYYSRRYLHDFHARKAYISTIQQKSADLRTQLVQHLDDQIEGEQRKAEEKARDEFKKVTQNLHHLVSTASTPGVYNPPYAADDEVPTAFNVPIEEHLRVGVKDFLRTRGLRTRRHPPSYAAGSRLTIQASSAYGVVEEARREEARYSKLRQMEPRTFSAGGKPREETYSPGITAGTKFQERWLAARGEREVEHSEEMKAKRVSDRPFVASVTRNRAFGEYERARSQKGKRRAKPGGLSETLASEHAPY